MIVLLAVAVVAVVAGGLYLASRFCSPVPWNGDDYDEY